MRYILIFICALNFLHAQKNPYSIFKHDNSELQSKIEDLRKLNFIIENPDTNHKVKFIAFDFNERIATIIMQDSSIYFKDIPENIKLRWLSRDPLESTKPHNSPYLGMGNSPIVLIDPDGKDEYYYNVEGSQVNHIKNDKPDKFFLHSSSDAKTQKPIYTEINLNNDDIGYLSRIIYAEARGENQQLKEAVADVTKNRVNSKKYPNTYKEVIEQKGKRKGSDNYTYQYTSVLPTDNNNDEYMNPLGTDGLSDIAFRSSLSAAIKVYHADQSITDNALLYYSPKSMKPKGSLPSWNFKLLEETTPSNVNSNAFRCFKYK